MLKHTISIMDPINNLIVTGVPRSFERSLSGPSGCMLMTLFLSPTNFSFVGSFSVVCGVGPYYTEEIYFNINF